MTCETLATKDDIARVESKLDSILAYFNNDIATKTDVNKLEARLNIIEGKLDDLLSRDVASGQQVQNIGDFLLELVERIVAPISQAIRSLENVTETIVLSARDVLSDLINALKSTLITAINGVKEVTTQAISSTENVLSISISSVSDVVKSGFETVTTTIKTIDDGIDLIKHTIDSIKSVVDNIVDNIRDIVNNIVDNIGVIANNIVTSIKDAIKNLTDEFFRYLDNATQTILNRIFDIYKYIISEIMEALSGSLNDIKSFIGQELSGLIDRILDALLGENDNDFLTQKLNLIADKASSIDGKIGTFPTGCDLYSSIGSVAQGLQMLVCGYSGDLGNNTLSQQELTNLLNNIMDAINKLNNTNPDNPDNPLSLTTMVDQIHKVLAPAEFDNAQVPKSLLSIHGESDLIPIATYPEFFLWYIKQFDALIGEFPISIEIEDTDLVEEGNQTKTVKIANIAEGISEIFGASFSNLTINDANLNILLRMIPEITRIRQLGLTNQDILIANQDFLGYRQKEVSREIKSQFKLTRDFSNLPELLAGETAKYKSIEFDDKDSLIDYLLRLQFVASLQKSWLTGKLSDLSQFVTDNQNPETSENVNTWNNFVTAINDPMSQFNYGEIPSKIRDVEE